MKTIGEAIVTAITWAIYTAIFRPIVLAAELVCLIIEFIFDIFVFPVQFMREMREREETE